jgi:hypothetical protein
VVAEDQWELLLYQIVQSADLEVVAGQDQVEIPSVRLAYPVKVIQVAQANLLQAILQVAEAARDRQDLLVPPVQAFAVEAEMVLRHIVYS